MNIPRPKGLPNICVTTIYNSGHKYRQPEVYAKLSLHAMESILRDTDAREHELDYIFAIEEKIYNEIYPIYRDAGISKENLIAIVLPKDIPEFQDIASNAKRWFMLFGEQSPLREKEQVVNIDADCIALRPYGCIKVYALFNRLFQTPDRPCFQGLFSPPDTVRNILYPITEIRDVPYDFHTEILPELRKYVNTDDKILTSHFRDKDFFSNSLMIFRWNIRSYIEQYPDFWEWLKNIVLHTVFGTGNEMTLSVFALYMKYRGINPINDHLSFKEPIYYQFKKIPPDIKKAFIMHVEASTL